MPCRYNRQGDIERKIYGSFTQTAAKIYAESSIFGFYRGATFRYARMCWYVEGKFLLAGHDIILTMFAFSLVPYS